MRADIQGTNTWRFGVRIGERMIERNAQVADAFVSARTSQCGVIAFLEKSEWLRVCCNCGLYHPAAAFRRGVSPLHHLAVYGKVMP